jgi:hypothetical protein
MFCFASFPTVIEMTFLTFLILMGFMDVKND